jgi:hypothetical protein
MTTRMHARFYLRNIGESQASGFDFFPLWLLDIVLPLTFLRTQTDITVEFKPLKECNTYELQWKEYPQKWQQLTSKEVSTNSKTTKVTASGLNPGSTYCVRLVCVQGTERGEPGPELIIDTEQVGCTPKTRGGCVVLWSGASWILRLPGK